MRGPGSGIAAVVILCVLVGCGYKTSPRPAAATVPGDVGLVEASMLPDRVVLKWQKPRYNSDGSPFDDLSGFKVYRSARKIGEECDNCPDEKKPSANVDFHNPVNAVFAGDDVTWFDKDVTQGNVYTYSVSAYNLKGREGEHSPETVVQFEEPPPPPENLKALIGPAGEVKLDWAAPPRAAGIKNYRVFRGLSEKIDEMTPIGGTKWAETNFADKDAEKKKTYYYCVRALKLNRGVTQESMASNTLKVDVPEPGRPTPENINTAMEEDSVRIFWDALQMPNAQTRYNIFRSESGEMMSKLNTEPLKSPSYVDKTVRKGRSYRWAVTAFPEGKPEEESGRSASEAVLFNP